MEGHQVCGIGLLVALYLTCCWARWRHARHYGQSFRLMGLVDFLDGWDHVSRAWRLLFVTWLSAGILLCASCLVG